MGVDGDIAVDDVPALLLALDEAMGRLIVALEIADLSQPSLLPGWTRGTIVAHLRYVGEATERMTRAALAGSCEAMYPGGREQRPPTLGV